MAQMQFRNEKKGFKWCFRKKNKTSEPDRKRKSNLRKERVSFLVKMEKDGKKTY